MAQQPLYRKTISEVILDLFRDNFQTGPFKVFREGDPIIFPASMLPALFISEPVTDYKQGATGFDVISHQLLIQLVFNKKDEFGAPDGASTMDKLLDQYIQGRDPVTGDLLPNSVLGVLRRNITLGNLVINQENRVEKYVLPRSEEMLTVEGHVRVTIDEEQAISNRV